MHVFWVACQCESLQVVLLEIWLCSIKKGGGGGKLVSAVIQVRLNQRGSVDSVCWAQEMTSNWIHFTQPIHTTSTWLQIANICIIWNSSLLFIQLNFTLCYLPMQFQWGDVFVFFRWGQERLPQHGSEWDCSALLAENTCTSIWEWNRIGMNSIQPYIVHQWSCRGTMSRFIILSFSLLLCSLTQVVGPFPCDIHSLGSGWAQQRQRGGTVCRDEATSRYRDPVQFLQLTGWTFCVIYSVYQIKSNFISYIVATQWLISDISIHTVYLTVEIPKEYQIILIIS